MDLLPRHLVGETPAHLVMLTSRVDHGAEIITITLLRAMMSNQALHWCNSRFGLAFHSDLIILYHFEQPDLSMAFN